MTPKPSVPSSRRTDIAESSSGGSREVPHVTSTSSQGMQGLSVYGWIVILECWIVGERAKKNSWKSQYDARSVSNCFWIFIMHIALSILMLFLYLLLHVLLNFNDFCCLWSIMICINLCCVRFVFMRLTLVQKLKSCVVHGGELFFFFQNFVGHTH